VRQQTESAAKIADFLAGGAATAHRARDLSRPQGRPSAGRDHRPADVGRLDADLLRRRRAARRRRLRCQNALEIIKISNNLGDAKSLITHPATTTQSTIANEGDIDCAGR
jgi:O-succinylhomoserine sulfhydrylase